MTVIAGIAARDVRQVLARRHDAIMAVTASTDDLSVIDDIDRHPHVGVMAILADICGLNMRHVLASGIRTVVATYAITGNVRVIEICRQPANA